MRQFKIIAEIFHSETHTECRHVKGFYYQGNKHIVLVGDEIQNHSIREKFNLDEVNIIIEKL